ncbi:MAG TPA: hypothetical protein VMU67_13885 [Steroidobacteraceae bacterium]|nr:hypothetical protein [Steroidobacteraceae bacterium]
MSAATSAVVAPDAFFETPQPRKSDAQREQDRLYNSGELKEIVRIDRSGRRISYFLGDPAAWLGPFSYPSKLVSGFGGAQR